MLDGVPTDLLEKIWILDQRGSPPQMEDIIVRLSDKYVFTGDELSLRGFLTD